MAQHHTLPLQLSEEVENQLLRQYAAFVHQLENGKPLQPQLLGDLRAAMRAALEAQPGFPQWRADAQLQHHLLHLTHPSNELLNLPWRLAVEDAPFLYLTKGLPADGALPAYLPTNALPLKVLVMIASPEDDSARLSYEEEEDQVINAFQPLYEHGQVQIDFTEDGSLPGLKRKLKDNHYHILHFSGHGIFKGGEGRLQLEDEISMRKVQVSGLEFAQALNTHPEHRPALLLLSSCQTAQGTTTDEFKGIANQLLQAGVPAVVAMGLSVLDYFATAFAGYFYRQLAEKQPLHRAFRAAIEHIRQEEARLRPDAAPGQWMIPQLYCSQRCEQLVDWERPFTPLAFSNLKFITGQNRLLLERHEGYQFLGRRRERRLALKPLLDKQPVLLRGQGGVGKTALAEHLVQRLMLHDGRAYPFVFNETSTSITGVLDALKNYLRKEHNQFLIDSQVEKASEKAMEQFLFLLGEVGKACEPVFVFDNLESFQEAPSGPFAEQYAGIKELITFLYKNNPFPLLLTGRYPLADFPDAVPVDMNAVRFADFWKKCQQLSISKLQQHLPQQKKAEAGSFRALAEQLHQAFGGNYRALEFFDKLYRANESEALDSLDKLQEYIRTYSGEVLNQMSENLVFGQLLALLEAPQRHCLGLLAQYRRPVLPLAVEVQEELPGLEQHLERLVALTLLERQREPLDRDSELVYYYVSPIVRTLLEQMEAALPAFSHRRAGNYYYHIVENVDYGYDSLEEAYHHYYLAESKEKINDIGTRLCNFYYGLSLFQMSLYYGQRTEALVGEQVSKSLLNIMGQAYQLYGKFDLALNYYERVQKKAEKENDLQWQGATLNNISQIHKARGDYGPALTYLERSLKITQEIGDRSGEGATLNNIAGIHRARGDYGPALTYLERSLKITQEIGGRSGEGTTLNNMATTAYARGDYGPALTYLERSLKIQQEIGDRSGEGTTLNNISQIHKARGDYGPALTYLERSLKIQQEIGDRSGEGTTLNNISQIHKARGDYGPALTYLERSLKIQQEIGDRSGEGTTLNNISQIYDARGDYGPALTYLERSLKIQQEIGDRSGEGITLNNMATTAYARGDYGTALTYLERSLKIQQEIGGRSGEGATLNNISQIHKARGDYDTALTYLERSLKIRQEIGDRSGMCATLHNMAHIARQDKKIEQFFEYEMNAYKIAMEIKDATALFHIGRDLGVFLCQAGQKEEGLALLQRSYEIGRQSGMQGTDQTAQFIQQYSQND